MSIVVTSAKPLITGSVHPGNENAINLFWQEQCASSCGPPKQRKSTSRPFFDEGPHLTRDIIMKILEMDGTDPRSGPLLSDTTWHCHQQNLPRIGAKSAATLLG